LGHSILIAIGIAMKTIDNFTSYYDDHLEGRYDCVDRIVLNGYFPLGQQGGGFRAWWRQLFGSDENLDQKHVQAMAGRFSRRIHAWAKKNHVPLIHCKPGERKHELAQRYIPQSADSKGLFLVLVAKAPGLVWNVETSKNGHPHLSRKTPWPYVNHYHFHIIDPEWGHITIKMSGHPPFGIQVMLNGHEWVERNAIKKTISLQKEGNCFVGGSFQALDQLADTLCDHHAIGRLARVCDRWAFTSCLCFALDLNEQERSNFHYRYSIYQLEYSRNLLFKKGTCLDAVYQGLIDRTRKTLDVKTLRTIFGYKKRPHYRKQKSPQLARILSQPIYDLTVFKLHFGPLTIKIYDKGARVLRVEAIAHNTKGLRCGRIIEKLPMMLTKLQQMVIDFLNVLNAAHKSFLPDDALDRLIGPTYRGKRRLAGVDLQNPRMCKVCDALLALSPNQSGFTTQELTNKVHQLFPDTRKKYSRRHVAYDLLKLRGKNLVKRISRTRRYCVRLFGVQILVGLFTLREKVIKPVLAGAGKPKLGPKPKEIHPVDQHYMNIQKEMRLLMLSLGVVG
jgi:hypothetical protein